MSIHTHYKQPSELYTVAVDFVDRIPAGATLQSATCVATDEAGASASGIVLSGPCTVATTKASQLITGGVNGQRYDLTITALLNNGNQFQDDVALFVREA